MYRGTTPTIIWTFGPDIDLTKVKTVWATIKSRTTTITKKTDQLEIDATNNQIKMGLTQEDTLKFSDQEMVEMQLRILDDSDAAFVTSITKDSMFRILEGGEIS